MSDIAERYRKVAAQFTQRVQAVPADAWDDPSPCDGWVARDVVRHLAEWMPALFLRADVPTIPSVDQDPVGAWLAVDAALQSALDDPEVAVRPHESPLGNLTLERAIDMAGTPDVLVHTWDLARATGLDERLDAEEVARLLPAMESAEEAMRASGHYGPRVEVSDDADAQSRLLAFTGRHP